MLPRSKNTKNSISLTIPNLNTLLFNNKIEIAMVSLRQLRLYLLLFQSLLSKKSQITCPVPLSELSLSLRRFPLLFHRKTAFLLDRIPSLLLHLDKVFSHLRTPVLLEFHLLTLDRCHLRSLLPSLLRPDLSFPLDLLHETKTDQS